LNQNSQLIKLATALGIDVNQISVMLIYPGTPVSPILQDVSAKCDTISIIAFFSRLKNMFGLTDKLPK